MRLAAAPALSRVEYARVIERTSVAAILTLRPDALSTSWIPAALPAAWLADVLALGGRLAAGTARLRRLARRGCFDPRLQSVGQRIAADLSFRGRFRVMLDGRVLLPCTSAALGVKTMIRSRISRLLALRPGRRLFRLRDAARVMAICLCCLVPVLAVFAQAQSQALPKDDPLFGAWENREYDASSRFDCAKWVIELDGHETDYRHLADTRPAWECWNTVEKRWIDEAGRHWYHLKVVAQRGVFEGFTLARISADGQHVRERLRAAWLPGRNRPAGLFLHGRLQAEVASRPR